ncbi:MAG: RtcB family protein [Candidatus Thermoplasmatota archaeon]|nr:RtcB family protein [Candidatus Thermoplasmatota archaeon]
MWNGPLNKIGEYRYEIPKTYKGERGNLNMRTSGIIYASDEMIDAIKKDNALEQVANVTTLPGIVGKSMAMPEIHWGYGFPIGGVAATSADDGTVSPGGVGFDINCGVRLVRTNLKIHDMDKEKVRGLVDEMFKNVPSGVGSKAKVRLNKNQLDDVIEMGARWAVENGYGWEKDLETLEENGCLETADLSHISEKAKDRGKSQVGSLGAGNHFLEIQRVANISDDMAAKTYGVEKDQIVVLIHTGSRGFGHQICTDHLKVLEQAVKKYGIGLPDRQLACAPVHSEEGQSYLKAMAGAANFAWCNRQMIVHWVRQSFENVLGENAEDMEMNIVYDVCHNVAKLEEHEIDGKKMEVYVHRKGATRAFGPGRKEIPLQYREVGQPVLIPGDMGTESYLLKGTKESEETFGSTCHGAGRVLSRSAAKRKWRGEEIGAKLERKGIYAHPASWSVMAEESPDAYKDVSQVVNVTHGAGLSLKVARMIPLGVVKG